MSNTIYIGATLSKLDLVSGTIYTERPEPKIEEVKEKFPLIGLLFVPVEEYSAKFKEMQKAGTAINTAFKQTRGLITVEEKL